MKKAVFIFCIFINTVNACPVCERNKPKLLRGITHGSNPDSNLDYVIVTAMLIITVFTLYYSIKWLLNPKEKNNDHIKYSFLNEQYYAKSK